MKQKPLNFIVPLVIYPFDVMVSFGETNEQMDVHFKKYDLTDKDVSFATITSKTVVGRTVMFSTNQTLIRMPKKPSTPRDYADLQHEIFHAVTFVMDRIGMKLVILKSDESYAYMVGYLTEQIYKKL